LLLDCESSFQYIERNSNLVPFPLMNFCKLITFSVDWFYFSFIFDKPTLDRIFFEFIFSSIFQSINMNLCLFDRTSLDFDIAINLLFARLFFYGFLIFETEGNFLMILFLMWFFLTFLNFIEPFSFEKFHIVFFLVIIFLFIFEDLIQRLFVCKWFEVYLVTPWNGYNIVDKHDLFEFTIDFYDLKFDCIEFFNLFFAAFLFLFLLIFALIIIEQDAFAVKKVIVYVIFHMLELLCSYLSWQVLLPFIFVFVTSPFFFSIKQSIDILDPMNVLFGFHSIYY